MNFNFNIDKQTAVNILEDSLADYITFINNDKERSRAERDTIIASVSHYTAFTRQNIFTFGLQPVQQPAGPQNTQPAQPEQPAPAPAPAPTEDDYEETEEPFISPT